MNDEMSIDSTDIALPGGVGDMGKRHPSNAERQRASQIFNFLKERMPEWKLKRSVKWKGYKEGRILIIATPGDTFAPDPQYSGRFGKNPDNKEAYTDYGLRLNIVCPSMANPGCELSLEIVALEQSNSENKDYRVHKISPEVFLKHTGCNYGLNIAKIIEEIPHHTPDQSIASQAEALVLREYDEITTVLVHRHFARPDSVIKNQKDIACFVDHLVKNGFKKEIPDWLVTPVSHDSSEFHEYGIHFMTEFTGVRASSSFSTNLSKEVFLQGVIRFCLETKGLRATIHTAPRPYNSSIRVGDYPEGHSTSKYFKTIDDIDTLEEITIRMIKHSVEMTYKRSKGWRKPVIWKEV